MATMKHVNPDDIRTLFSRAMSDMYRAEAPQYGALLELVADVNDETTRRDPDLKASLERAGEFDRLSVERHGAIRLGTAQELVAIRRVFAVMGMHPVGHYDLSVAGIPAHSTAFRPINDEALRRNPFRVFTSLLRLELIEDEGLRAEAAAILAARNILTPRAIELVAAYERQGSLTAEQAEEFVREALETFRWHGEATVTAETYNRLNDAHRLIADVVSFRGPHINHLTPRTLDIDAAQAGMPKRGIQSGNVKVTVVSEQGKEAVVAMLGTNDFFGEGSLAGQARRIATVATIMDSVIVRLEKAAIVRVIHQEPAFSEMFIAHLLARAIRVEADLVDQLFNSSEKRLARLLLLLANFGKDEKPEPILAKISQETLADMIGTTRSRVSFFMNKSRKLGLIDYNGGIEVHSSLLNVVLHDEPHIQI
jgi:CRP-like cAMP-binding protein